jgi:hypothetical protein
MSRGNSRTHANSWVGYCRLSRTRITGYKRKRLGHPSEKLASDVPRAGWRTVLSSEVVGPIVMAILFSLPYLFVKSYVSIPFFSAVLMLVDLTTSLASGSPRPAPSKSLDSSDSPSSPSDRCLTTAAPSSEPSRPPSLMVSPSLVSSPSSSCLCVLLLYLCSLKRLLIVIVFSLALPVVLGGLECLARYRWYPCLRLDPANGLQALHLALLDVSCLLSCPIVPSRHRADLSSLFSLLLSLTAGNSSTTRPTELGGPESGTTEASETAS